MRKIIGFVVLFAVAMFIANSILAADKPEVSGKDRFNAIRSFVARVNTSQFKVLIREEVSVVYGAVNVSKTKLSQKLVFDEILAKFGTLPEFADRKVAITTFRPKTSSFTAEAISLGDNVFISEILTDRLLERPEGRGVIEAIIAHELSHGSRDFLVKRAIANDTVLSAAEKSHFFLEIELEADRGAVDLLQRVNSDTREMITMLTGFGETERLKEVENLLRSAASSR